MNKKKQVKTQTFKLGKFHITQAANIEGCCDAPPFNTAGMMILEGDDLKALAATPTLLILDNLESLKDETLKDKIEDRQSALLDAAARWSRAGQTRVIITTRQDHLDHPEFPTAQHREHQYLPLSGLAEHDAVATNAGAYSATFLRTSFTIFF